MFPAQADNTFAMPDVPRIATEHLVARDDFVNVAQRVRMSRSLSARANASSLSARACSTSPRAQIASS